MIVLADPFKDKVKITFFHGAQLADPKKLFNNGLDGNKWRAIDIYQGDKINKTDLKALFREAMAYNTTLMLVLVPFLNRVPETPETVSTL